MSHSMPLSNYHSPLQLLRPSHAVIALTFAASSMAAWGNTSATSVPLADQPVFASSEVPGNLALALSVEWPTASRTAHTDNYTSQKSFLGYFDPNKCYKYISDTRAVTSPGGTKVETGKGDHSYFTPARTTQTRQCSASDEWSGNFLNWASLTTIDPFRWAMTGGRRVVDEVGETIIEKGWHSGQGLFATRSLPANEIAGATAFPTAKTLKIEGNGRGYAVRIYYTNQNGSNEKNQDFTIRVKVCDASVGIESNCVQYGNNWKPEGLIQQYANKMRFSAFGYMNHSGNTRDGGVLRARQKFVGPTFPRPGDTPQTNTNAEWNPTTGQMIRNPDSADAADTSQWASLSGSASIQDSGVMNYLNKFGQVILGDYKSNDPVNELFYATLRYYRGLGNIAAWSNLGTTNETTKRAYIDGFPVIRDWTKEDPIQHACQRNFILGIGDIYTHSDRNVPGSSSDSSPTKPSFNDPIFDASASLDNLKKLQNYAAGGAGKTESQNSSSDHMAGLAFEANTLDIRPDDIDKRQTLGKQTVQTYWVDVLEQSFSRNNKFYLAAKFGGLNQSKLPETFNPYTYNGAIPLDWWSTSGDKLIDTRNNSTWDRPDNYFTAGKPDDMVSGLQNAFLSISNEIRAYTTSFSYTSSDVTSGQVAYASKYDSTGWTGAVTARQISYATDSGKPNISEVWNTDTTLSTQFSDTGWDVSRRIVTWNASLTQPAVPFRYNQLSTLQKQRLNTSYTASNNAESYLNYLRGDKLNEVSSTNSSSTRQYRSRNSPLADIVNSKITAISKPIAVLRNDSNPGYSDFKANNINRQTMIYVGANDGMMHAFFGSGNNAGKEAFAYIPSDMFNLTYAQSGTTGEQGPDSILGNLGNPNYLHKYSVDATPLVFDVDFNSTSNSTVDTPDWRSILVGGLGKGGYSFYAIDVTNPASMNSESAVADKVLWEFKDEKMGFSFGAPIVVKTNKYGWVAILTSGYNNSDGYGYLYIVHPKTGALLEKIKTTELAPGMAQASAFIPDFGDGTTDAVYAGDLNGTIWRFDLTGNSTNTPYPSPTPIAKLKDKSGNNLAITTAPLIEIHPDTRFRYVLVGTGKLLDLVDVTSAQEQSFFAIKDGTAGAFKVHSTPVVRASLRQVTDLSTSLPLDMADAGWYLDLGNDDSSGIGWRVIATPIAASDVVAFTSMLTTGDACSPAGVSRVYALNFAGGKTALSNEEPYVEFESSVTDLRLLEVDGTVRLIAGDNQGNIESIDIKIGIGNSLRLLNWRETFSFD